MAGEQERKTSQEAERQLPPDLAILLAAIRGEFDAKIGGLKAWGVAMCLGGGAIGGFVAEVIRPGIASQALGLLPFV